MDGSGGPATVKSAWFSALEPKDIQDPDGPASVRVRARQCQDPTARLEVFTTAVTPEATGVLRCVACHVKA